MNTLTMVTLLTCIPAPLQHGSAIPPPHAALAALMQVDDRPDELEARAVEAMKRMTALLTSTDRLRFKTRCTWEAIQDFDMKLQFDAVQEVSIRRPAQMAAITIRDDGTTKSLWFDNGKLTLLKLPANEYVQLSMPTTIDGMLDHLLDNYDIPAPPMLDFLYSDTEESFLEDVERAYYVGESYVHGQKCHHLALSKGSVDYQVWLPLAGKPLPIKYSILWRNEPLMPSFTARFLEWDTDAELSGAEFKFVKPPAAKETKLPPKSDKDDGPGGRDDD